jgi:aminoglycoside phosphotransferase (APT) family kinase protein
VDDLMGVLARLESRLGAVTQGPVPLQGGITNRNFRVSFGERECVVRLPGKDTTLLGISRAAERIANRAAAVLGIAPAVLAGDDECLVTAWVASLPTDPASLCAAPEPIGAALRAFHDADVRLPVRFWVPELLESYAELVRKRGGSLPEQYGSAHAIAQRIAEALPLEEPVPCHDDLLVANVLRVESERTVMLVDWEYAGMGHRFFDLGNLAVNAQFDEAAEARLLAAYFDEQPSRGRMAALRLMRIMSDAREAAWGVLQSVVSELDVDFEHYAARHFARLEAAASDPRLEEWLDAASA